MTTVVGIQKVDGCVLVADSRTTGETGRPYSHILVQKITMRGEFLIGGAGDPQACDIVQHIWEIPEFVEDEDAYRFMVTKVAPSIRTCLKDNGYEKDKDDKDSGFVFLLAFRGTIYELDETFTISMTDSGIYGIGSGSKYAIGALQAGADWQTAMEIAERNDIYTAAPFCLFQQDKN